jgi:hypothetical protein
MALPRTGIVMNQNKIGNRIVVIAGSTNEKPGYWEPAKQRPKARRIVVIRNGKLVRSRRSR